MQACHLPPVLRIVVPRGLSLLTPLAKVFLQMMNIPPLDHGGSYELITCKEPGYITESPMGQLDWYVAG